MTTRTLTLAEFLLARIAEDEAAAQSGASAPTYPHFGDTAAEESIEMALNESCAEGGAEHFRRWLPARVLAECEAKRRIVAVADPLHGLGPVVLKALAAVYADHPDYDEAWRP